MSAARTRGTVYRCPVCGAELMVVADRIGAFHPRCCNRDMAALAQRARSYVCPVCGAELAVVRRGEGGDFRPRCCNTAMALEAA